MAFDYPAVEREYVLTFPTPKLRDLIFYEVRDSDLPVNDWQNLPENYGETEHPDKAQFPDHVLTLITAGDERGRQKWWYAADREDQDDYNYQFSFPYAGFREFPRITRYYVFRRADYEALPKGTLDPKHDDPDDERFKNARLVDEKEVDLGVNELKSIYIAVRRTYDRVPTPEEQLAYNASRSYPYAGLKGFPRTSRNFIYPRQDFTPTEKGTPDPVYSDSLLISEEQKVIEDPMLASLYVAVTRTYDEVPSLTEQETFNYEITYPYYNHPDYPRYLRTYVVKREELATLALSTADPTFPDATLVTQKVDRFQDPALDSIYVLVRRVFDTIPDISNEDDAAFLTSVGYRITRPHGLDEYPRVEWRFPIEKSLFSMADEYSSCPIPGYTSLKLTGETFDEDKESADRGFVVRVFDTFPGPAIQTLKIEEPLGIPQRFIDRMETTQTTKRLDENGNPAAVGGDATDDGATIESSFGSDGISKVIFSQGSTEVKIDAAPLEGYRLDQDTGKVFPTKETLVPAGTAGADVDEQAFFEEVSPLNPRWSIKARRKATGLVDEVTYQTVVTYSWPAVLEYLTFFPIKSKPGDYISAYGHKFELKDGYVGPCIAQVTEGWSKNPPAVELNAAMQPRSISWRMILTKGDVPRCLHPAFSIYEIVGTDHPTLSYTINEEFFDGTNYIDWPASIVAKFNVSRYRGGYRYEKVEIQAPNDV